MQYVATIHFNAPEDAESLLAFKLAADRVEVFDSRIQVNDIKIEEVHEC
jgi:hypothetical protein